MSKLIIIVKSAVFIICAYLMVSCAVQKLSISETQSVDKVAILSELDNHMNKVMVGVTIFNNDSSQSSINAWNINHNIENDIAQKLWSKGKEVVILQTSTTEIMQEKKKLLINQASYKGAQLVIIVKPVYQVENYPLFPEGYGLFERNTLGFKQRLLYASIVYEVYSTKDGNRKGYYLVRPEGSDVIKLDTNIPYEQLTESKMLEYKQQLFTLFDQIDTNALKQMGFY